VPGRQALRRAPSRPGPERIVGATAAS
jgi:hypothetical protein